MRVQANAKLTLGLHHWKNRYILYIGHLFYTGKGRWHGKPIKYGKATIITKQVDRDRLNRALALS